MTNSRIRTRLALLAATGSTIVAGTAIALASPTASVLQTGQEAPSLQIEAGRVLEMTIDTSMERPEYSWILTRDRKFINAQRARFFQTRQTVPATYVLDVNIQDTVNNQTEYRVFNVVVNPPTDTPRIKRQTEGDLKAILTAEPWDGQGTVTLPSEGGMVRLDMHQSIGDIASFSLDLDTGVDSDGDGNLENDRDNALTAGEKDATPLYVYMLPKSTPRRVILTVTNPDNTQTSRAILTVSFSGQATTVNPSTTTPVTTAGNNVILAEKRGLTVTYSGRIDQAIRATRELLLEWDFGDRSRSLLSSPVHTYTKNGIYTVTLTVRDIATGEVVLTGSETLQVQAEQVTTPPTPTPTTPGTSPTTPVKVTPTPTKKGTGSIGSVIKVIGIVFFLIALAVAMFFALRWLKNKTANKLQQTLDTMETAVVAKQEEKSTQKKATTMKLKKEKKTEKNDSPTPVAEPPQAAAADITLQETKNAEFKSGEDALVSAPTATQDAPVPDWLKGPAASPVVEQKPAAPVASAPAPEPTPAPLAVQDAPVPDWLKPQQTAASQPSADPLPVQSQADPAAIPDWLKGPAASPVVEQKPAAPVASAPAPEPTPAPLAVQDAPVPDWLKPQQTAAPQPSADPTPVQPQASSEPQADPAAIPDWLKGPAGTPAVEQKPAAPVASAPAPEPTPAPLAVQDAPVPDWLKPQQTAAPQPSADPTPVQPQASSEPQADPAAIPDWLKGPAASPVVEQKPAAPVASAPAPEPTPAPLAVQDAPVVQAPSSQPVVVASTQTQSQPAAPAPSVPPVTTKPATATVASVAQAPTPVAKNTTAPAPRAAATPRPAGQQQPKRQHGQQQRKPQPQPQKKQQQQPQGKAKPQQSTGASQPKMQPQPAAPKPAATPAPLPQSQPKQTSQTPEDRPIAIIKAESISAPATQKKPPAEAKDIPRVPAADDKSSA